MDRNNPSRRRFVVAAVATVAAEPLSGLVHAQAAASGSGPSDNVARFATTHMVTALGCAFVIDNKAGAGGNIGTDAVARARPNGNTLLLATVASHGLNPVLHTTVAEVG